jgi:hypothetical protein
VARSGVSMAEYFNKEDGVWSEKGATLSDSTARKEFGLSQQDIIDAIKKDKLQYRQTSIYGNPCIRLLRHEVESLVNEKYGDDYLNQKKLKKELSQVTKELKKLKSEIDFLEEKKNTILKSLNN